MSVEDIVLDLQGVHGVVDGLLSQNIHLEFFYIRTVVVFPFDERLHIFPDVQLSRHQQLYIIMGGSLKGGGGRVGQL